MRIELLIQARTRICFPHPGPLQLSIGLEMLWWSLSEAELVVARSLAGIGYSRRSTIGRDYEPLGIVHGQCIPLGTHPCQSRNTSVFHNFLHTIGGWCSWVLNSMHVFLCCIPGFLGIANLQHIQICMHPYQSCNMSLRFHKCLGTIGG